MSGSETNSDSTNPNPDKTEARRSPVQPKRPDEFQLQPEPTPKPDKKWASEPISPSERLSIIREKMERIADEYANRKISRTQFNAIYGHYSEQRTLIERLISKDPSNAAWKQAARSGKTSFLRTHFEATARNYVIYLHETPNPLMGGGSRPDLTRINILLQSLWAQPDAKRGVARLALQPPEWLVIAVGYFGVTLVTFHLEPSGTQVERVHDLHQDFERANSIYLKRGITDRQRIVFPQRALLEQAD